MKELRIQSSELIPLIEDKITNTDVYMTIKGNSMRPFYKSGKTVIRLSKIKYLNKYDVILFKYNNKYILHRIISIDNKKIIARGDGLLSKEVINIKDCIAIVKSHKTNNKIIYSNSKIYLFKVKLWNLMYPIRRILLKFTRR